MHRESAGMETILAEKSSIGGEGGEVYLLRSIGPIDRRGSTRVGGEDS